MNIIHSNSTGKLYPITLVGEILIDEIHDLHSNGKSQYFGGSPANIALNFVDLGIQNVQFAGAVGKDEFGKKLRDNFIDNNLSTKFLDTYDGNTSIVRINKTQGSPIPSFERDADYNIVMNDDLRITIAKSTLLHFTCWPLTKQPARNTVLEAIQIAKEHNVIIGFDPNYHPKLDLDKSVITNELLNIMKHVDIIKPSYDDAKRIFGGENTPEAYLQMFADLGIKMIIMTLGKDGLLCRFQDDIISLPSKATEVVDATGAGDAFLSGLYSAIIDGEDLLTALQLGLLCSAYNLKHIGGRSHLPDYNTLRQKIDL